jgi:hypothetical protein
MALINTLIQAELPSVEALLKTHPDFFDAAITPCDAATLIGSTVAALAQMRTRGGGPPYTRISSHTDSRGYVRGPIRYTRRSLIVWLQERLHHSTAGEN